MEKVKRNPLFPPLAKPTIKRRENNNWKLSAEGQKVMTELEKRSRYYRRMRNRICGGIYESESTATNNKDEYENEGNDYCIACAQRISLKPMQRHNSENSKSYFDLGRRENVRQCVCILCKKVLTPTPHGLRQTSIESVPSSSFRDTYLGFNMKHREELLKDFRISALDYDSRLVSPQTMPHIEQQMPPKEVMMKSERKCQSWLIKNQEYFKSL